MKRSAPALILTLFLLTLIVAAALQYRLPSSLPADASPQLFSAGRAVQYIKWIPTASPQRVGSPDSYSGVAG